METMTNPYPKKMHDTYEDEEERKHFQRIVSAFKYYKDHSLSRVKKTEFYLSSLPTKHQKLLSKYREHLQEVKRCIENNDKIIKLIIKDVAHIFENVSPSSAQTESVRKVHLVGLIADIKSSSSNG